MALSAEEASDYRDMVVSLFEDHAARNEAGSPFVEIGAVLAAVGVDIFLGDTVDDRANSGPHTRTGTHGARLVCGIEDKIGEVAAVTAGNVFESFKLYVLDARARRFYAISGVGDDHFALANQPCDDRADGIIATLTGAPSLGNSKLHELFSWFVGVRDHADRVYRLLQVFDWRRQSSR